MIWLVVGVVAIGLTVGLVTIAIANSMLDSSVDGFPGDYLDRTIPSVQVDEDQDNWTLTIVYYEDDSSETVSLPGLDNIFLVVVSPDGEVTFSPKSLGSMEPGVYYDGVRFFNTGDLERLDSGDCLTLDSRIFEQGSFAQLMWLWESGGGSIGFSLY